jgi:hypothetical protein
MLTFCVFADLHYRVGDWSWCERRLDRILERACREKAAFVMHCGDFCHDVIGAHAIIDKYNHAPIPAYHTVGNHDFESTDGLSIVLDAYRMPKNFYCFDKDGVRLISLDTNYHYGDDGKLLHYADDTAWAKCHQSNLIIPPEELDFLCDALATSSGPCVIFSHSSAIREHSLANAHEIRRRVKEARKGHPVLWINGHHHRNRLTFADGSAWLDLNTASSDWLNTPHHLYPAELMSKYGCSDHTLLLEDELSAIITVDMDGTFDIHGSKTQPYLGITHEMAGNSSYDEEGCPFDYEILSARFKLD